MSRLYLKIIYKNFPSGQMLHSANSLNFTKCIRPETTLTPDHRYLWRLLRARKTWQQTSVYRRLAYAFGGCLGCLIISNELLPCRFGNRHPSDRLQEPNNNRQHNSCIKKRQQIQRFGVIRWSLYLNSNFGIRYW
jgi:hypothetical protein